MNLIFPPTLTPASSAACRYTQWRLVWRRPGRRRSLGRLSVRIVRLPRAALVDVAEVPIIHGTFFFKPIGDAD